MHKKDRLKVHYNDYMEKFRSDIFLNFCVRFFEHGLPLSAVRHAVQLLQIQEVHTWPHFNV